MTERPRPFGFSSVLPVAEASERGDLARDVHILPGARGMTLYDTVLIEDDGPGASSWHAPVETVRGALQARKILWLDGPEARTACLVLCAEPVDGERAPLTIRLNGRVLTLAPGRAGWQALPVPLRALRRGRNEVTFACERPTACGWRIPIALRENILQNDPVRRSASARSFRSVDGGRTWSARLGNGAAVAGEYMVRLNLARHAPRGELIGPVLDLAEADGPEGWSLDGVGATAVRIVPKVRTPPGTSVRFFVRSGTNPVGTMKGWSGWSACSRAGFVRGRFHRFVQWKAVLSTRRPTVSPVLEAVACEADVSRWAPAWSRSLRAVGGHNETIVHTSIPFAYERFDEPPLAELRRAYRLDRVVAAGRTEQERMTLLRNWVSKQWEYLPFEPPCPAWDAREILDRRTGVCVQYAIVYMQCALALGMQTRFVFGHVPGAVVGGRVTSGHEVNEYWSNEHGRWCYMDPRQDDTYGEASTGLPVSMLAFHDETMRTYFAEAPVCLEENRVEARRTSEALRLSGRGDETPRGEPATIPFGWACICLLPRNNLFACRFPEPIAQGRSPWSWPGYWLWWDGRTPRLPHLRHFTCRRADFEWTLNQVRWAAAPARRRGTVRVAMGTVTPDLDGFLVRVDGGRWRRSEPGFVWKLCPGRNRLEMRVRNRAGILGPVSRLELDDDEEGR